MDGSGNYLGRKLYKELRKPGRLLLQKILPCGNCITPSLAVLCVVGARIAASPAARQLGSAALRQGSKLTRATGSLVARGAKATGRFLKEKGTQILKKGKELYQTGKKLAKKGLNRLSKQNQKIFDKSLEKVIQVQNNISQGINKTKQIGEQVKNTLSNTAININTGNSSTKTEKTIEAIKDFGTGYITPSMSSPRNAVEAAGTVGSEVIKNNCNTCALK